MVRFLLRRSRRAWRLEDCLGYAVEDAHGRLGVLESVERDGAGRARLVVRGGRLLQRRRLAVAESAVTAIDGERRRLHVRDPRSPA